MVALNPFVAGPSVCPFTIVAKKTVGKGIHICELKSIFTHNDACPVVRGKVTSKILMKDKSFVATVANFGGRASEKVMRAEAAKRGVWLKKQKIDFKSTGCVTVSLQLVAKKTHV